jgi:hypothetical protein
MDGSPSAQSAASVPPSPSKTPVTLAEIIEVLDKFSEKAPPPAGWQFLKQLPSVRRVRDPERLQRELRARFDVDPLARSGVLRRTKHDAELTLAPVLRDGAPFLVVRYRDNGEPFEIIGWPGCTMSRVPALFPVLQRLATRPAKPGPRLLYRVLAACSAEDFLLLRMLGYPAAPATGLATLTLRQGLRLYRHRVGHEFRREDSCAPVDCDFQIVLVGWNISRLSGELPEMFAAVLERLATFEEALGVMEDLFRVWVPSPDEIAKFRRIRGFADGHMIGRAIDQSVENSSDRLYTAWQRLGAPRSDDYRAARLAVYRSLQRSQSVPTLPADSERERDGLIVSFRALIGTRFSTARSESQTQCDGSGTCWPPI